MQNTISTKDKILETALKLFAAKGYESVGTNEIVMEAGITKPTLYYYCGSKLGLLKEIIDTHGEKLLNAVKAAAEYKHDLAKHLTDILKAVADAAASDPYFFRLHSVLASAAAETEAFSAHKNLQDSINSCFLKLFMEATAEIGNMKGSEALYSRTFRYITESSSLAALNGELIMNDDTVYKIIHSFMYGIVN